MTYPPNNPGYPAPQQPGGYAAPAAPSAPAFQVPPVPSSKAPAFLAAAVIALGFAAYLAGFGPLLRIKSDIGPFGGAQFTASGMPFWTVAALLAALLAAVGLLPKAKSYTPVTAVIAVLGVLMAVSQIINLPNGFSVGWGLWMGLLFTVLQAVAAVTALMFSAGVMTPPAPRPNYGQYGPPPGYYGQPGGQPGYPAQYGGYVSSGQGPSGQPFAGADAPATPPTGFPSYTPSSSAPPQSSSPVAPEPAPGPTPGTTQP